MKNEPTSSDCDEEDSAVYPMERGEPPLTSRQRAGMLDGAPARNAMPHALLALCVLSCRPSGFLLAPDEADVPRDSAAPSDDSADEPTEVLPGALPVFSHERGFYDASFQLSVSSPLAGVEVRCTTDGRDPVEYGQALKASLAIEGSTVVRAALFRDDQTLGDSVTHSYLFAAQVPQQRAPEDYPSRWFQFDAPGGYPSDYEMDEEITQDPAYADAFPDCLRSLPAISLVMDPDDLFGEEGIHENPFGEGEEWERPTSFEWLPSDDSSSIQANAGLRLYGGYCRYPEYAKKTFRVFFKSQYGPAELQYPFFADSAVDSFDTLVLRARFDLSWIHGSDSTRDMAQYTRDQLARETQVAMGSLSTHGRHAHLYINGLYWGLYVLHERPDAHFLAAHLGGEDEDWDVLNSGEAVDGDREAWEELMRIGYAGLASDEAYAELQQYVDLENLADYLIMNAWLGNYEWPNHNWYAARRREKGAGYVFFSWDAEATMSDLQQDLTDANYPDSPGQLYHFLQDNEDFRTLMAERIQVHFFDDGALTTEAMTARWQALSDAVEPAMVAESARWGDSRRDVYGDADELYTYLDHWIPERDRLRDDYLPFRNQVVLEQYRAMGMYPP